MKKDLKKTGEIVSLVLKLNEILSNLTDVDREKIVIFINTNTGGRHLIDENSKRFQFGKIIIDFEK